MKDKTQEQAENALARFSDMNAAVYECLEEATEVARAYFDVEGNHWDGYMFSHIVRYKSLGLLRAGKNSGKFKHDFFAASTANSGILIHSGGTRFRVFKADDGELPPPRESETRKEFYDQPRLPCFPRELDEAPPPDSRLVYLWDIDGHHNLSTLSLVCPKGVISDDEWRPPSSWWQIAVPHPATKVVARQTEPQEEGILLVERIDKERDGQG